MNKIKKLSLPLKIALTILLVVAILISGLAIVFRNEISTINTIEKINDYPMYTMTYKGDYAFDEFLEVGASTDADVVEFVSKTLLKGLPIKIELPDLGCSTMLAKTPEEDYLFGRNFDLDFSHTEPDNGYKSVSVVNLAFMGYNENKMPDGFTDSIVALAAPYVPIDGMNEMGLSVGVLLIDEFELTSQDSGKVDLQTTTAIRMMLDKCATVEEAIAMLSEYDMHSSAGSTYHFQIADATGDSAIVEYIGDQMNVIEPEEFYQACTNFILSEGEHYGYGKGHDRYEILMNELTAKNGILTNEEAMNLMQDVSVALKENDEGKISGTQWSVVYNLTAKTGEIAVGMDYDTITTFDLEQTNK